MELENGVDLLSRFNKILTELKTFMQSEQGSKHFSLEHVIKDIEVNKEQVDLLWHKYKAEEENFGRIAKEYDNVTKTLKRREDELAQIKKENLDIRKEVNGKNRKLENKVSELYSELEEQERKFNKKESEMQDEIHHLDEKLKKLSDENTLVKELEKAEEQCAEFQMETRSVKEKNQELQDIIDKMTIDLQDSYASIGRMDVKNEKLRKDHEALGFRYISLEEANTSLDQQVANLEEINERLTEELKNKVNKSVLQKSYDELTNKHNRLMMSHDKLNQDLDETKGELAKAWNQVQDRDHVISRYLKPNNRMSHYQNVRTQNKKLIDANLVLQEQVRELEQQSGLLSKIADMKEKDKQIRADRFRLMRDYDEQLKTLRELLQKEKVKHKEFSNKAEELATKNRELGQKYDKLLNKVNHDIGLFQTENDKLKEENKSLKKSNKKLVDNVLVLTGKVTNYESMTEFETKIAEQKERIAQLRKEKYNLTEATKEEIEILRKALNREKEKNKQYTEMNTKLRAFHEYMSETEAGINNKMISIRQKSKGLLDDMDSIALNNIDF